MDTGERIKVGVVDDHDLLVAGVRALLSTQNSPARFVAGSATVPGLLRAHRAIDIVCRAPRHARKFLLGCG